MNNPIYPALWFNGIAREAAEFYCSVFPNTTIKMENQFMVTIEISGQKFIFINGGPEFTINPSISFFVVCETEQELDHAWEMMLNGGSVLMPLNKYEWSEKYGWLEDKYGANWQLSLGKMETTGQKITPTLMFSGNQNGNAEKAIQFYTSVFNNASVVGILRYDNDPNEINGHVKHAQFKLDKTVFMAMDSSLPHRFSFNEAISFVVECETQHEIDHYWEKLSAVPEAEACGWLKDQFGVSWQIIPTVLQELMNDRERAPRIIQAFMSMKKFNIEKILDA